MIRRQHHSKDTRAVVIVDTSSKSWRCLKCLANASKDFCGRKCAKCWPLGQAKREVTIVHALGHK